MKSALTLFGLSIHLLATALEPSDAGGEKARIQQQAQQLQNARTALLSQLEVAEGGDVLFLPLWQEGLTIPVKRETLEAALDLWLVNPQVTPEDRKQVERFASNYSDRYEYTLTQKQRDLAIDADLIEMEYERVAKRSFSQTSPNPQPIAMNRDVETNRKHARTSSLPWDTKQEKKPIANNANLSIDIEDVQVDSRLGYRRWDFTRVFKETNGVGAHLTEYEMSLETPIEEARQSRKGSIDVRIEPNSELRRRGYMWLEESDPKYQEKHLTGKMTMIFRGTDDQGNPVELKSVFRR